MSRITHSGFALIELLIVVLMIGILTAITVPKFSNSKEKAYLAAMRTDLRKLATAEEPYFYSNAVCTTNPASLNFTDSPGVTISIPEATTKGWSGIATNPLAGDGRRTDRMRLSAASRRHAA